MSRNGRGMEGESEREGKPRKMEMEEKSESKLRGGN